MGHPHSLFVFFTVITYNGADPSFIQTNTTRKFVSWPGPLINNTGLLCLYKISWKIYHAWMEVNHYKAELSITSKCALFSWLTRTDPYPISEGKFLCHCSSFHLPFRTCVPNFSWCVLLIALELFLVMWMLHRDISLSTEMRVFFPEVAIALL